MSLLLFTLTLNKHLLTPPSGEVASYLLHSFLLSGLWILGDPLRPIVEGIQELSIGCSLSLVLIHCFFDSHID